MDFQPFPHQGTKPELRALARSITAKFDEDYWDSCDRDKRFPEEFFQDFASAGLLGITIPEQYGGGGGSLSDLVAVLEEVAAGGGAINACSSVHIPLLCIPTLLAFGTESQKSALLPRIAAGELFVTFGVTEPNAGTDTTKISTRALPADDGYLISGTKVWNSGALRGDKILVLARTSTPDASSKRAHGLTLFLTDLESPNIDIRAIPKIGRNAVASAEVHLDDHFAADAEVIGEVGQGFYHLLHSLNGERLYLSAEALGVGRWALRAAARYANERVVFDRPIGRTKLCSTRWRRPTWDCSPLARSCTGPSRSTRAKARLRSARLPTRPSILRPRRPSLPRTGRCKSLAATRSPGNTTSVATG